MKKEYRCGVDWSNSKDFSAITLIKDNEILISEVSDKISEINEMRIKTINMWLEDNGVTIENSHKYTIETVGNSYLLRHKDKIISEFKIY